MVDNKVLFQNREIIAEEVNKVIIMLNSRRNVDEYMYILLWRPIEWILDYYALEDSLKHNPNITIGEFRKIWNFTVDEKVYGENIGKRFFEGKTRDNVCDLRWHRNATIHHYNNLKGDKRLRQTTGISRHIDMKYPIKRRKNVWKQF